MAAPAVSIKTGRANSSATVMVSPGIQTPESNSPVPRPPKSNLTVWASLWTGKRMVADSSDTGMPNAVLIGPSISRYFFVESF
ncbi:hypothetical protein D3C87_1924100 [compost metagenome]